MTPLDEADVPEPGSALERDIQAIQERVSLVAGLTVRVMAEFVGLDDHANRTTADLYDELLSLDQHPFWSLASCIAEAPPEARVEWLTLVDGQVATLDGEVVDA